MQKIDWQDVADRSAWTFAQSFLAVLVAAQTSFVSGAVWKSAAVAGGAAVLSFLKNVAFGAQGNDPPAAQ